MNGIYQKTEQAILAPPIATWKTKSARIQNTVSSLTIVLAGLAAFFLVLLLKSRTTVSFQIEPLFFVYSIFVTTFAMSRLLSALFYRRSMKAMISDSAHADIVDGFFEPDVTFVIPCKNEERNIAATVQKCFEADYPKEKLEVIVVNDGSTDGTLAVLQELERIYPNLTVVHWEKNRGKRQGMAEGFRRARGEIVVQLDSDSYVVPSTFRELIRPFVYPEIAGVCAHADPANADENVITRMQAAYYFASFRILKAAESTYFTVFCLSGCASAYRKSAVLPVIDNWLNEKFLGLPATWGDDRALSSWVIKDGHKTIYNEKALCRTICPNTVRSLFKQQLRWKKSWIVNACLTSRFIWKVQPFVSFFYYFPLIIVSLLTPIMAFRSIVWAPAVHRIFPWYQLAGVLLITAIIVAYYRFVGRKNPYWPYLFLWSTLNMVALALVMFWAVVKIQDRGWGTR